MEPWTDLQRSNKKHGDWVWIKTLFRERCVNTIDLDIWSMEICQCWGCRYLEIFSQSSARFCKVSGEWVQANTFDALIQSASSPWALCVRLVPWGQDWSSLRRHSSLHKLNTEALWHVVIVVIVAILDSPGSFWTSRPSIFTNLVIGCVIVGQSIPQWGFHRFPMQDSPNHRRIVDAYSLSVIHKICWLVPIGDFFWSHLAGMGCARPHFVACVNCPKACWKVTAIIAFSIGKSCLRD